MNDMVSKCAEAALEMLKAQKEFKLEKAKVIFDPAKLATDMQYAKFKTAEVDKLLMEVDVDSDEVFSTIYWFREQQRKDERAGKTYSGRGKSRLLEVIESIQYRRQEALL